MGQTTNCIVYHRWRLIFARIDDSIVLGHLRRIFHVSPASSGSLTLGHRWRRGYYKMVCRWIVCWCGSYGNVHHRIRMYIIHWRCHKTAAAITSFVLLMALNPEIQSKAQSEIDLAFGDSMFREHSDIPNPDNVRKLKYLTALFKELLRYAPVGNLGDCG